MHSTHDETPARSAVSKTLEGLLWLGALGLAGALAAPYAMALEPRLDLFSHFRVQIAGLSIAGTLVAALLRFGRLAAFGALLTAFAGWGLVPLFAGAGPAARPGAESLRFVMVNVLTQNSNHAEATRWLGGVDADVVVALELNDGWAEAIDAGLPGHRRLPTDTLRDDNFGIAVYVRKGLEAHDLSVHSTDRDLPWIEAVIGSNERRVRLFALHTTPPLGSGSTESRDAQIAEAFERARASAEPAVVTGDLNATPWSRGLAREIARGGLYPAAYGRGLRGTWPSRLVGPTGGILIDHALVDERLAVTDYAVGPDIGSDHRGIVFGVAPAAN